MYGAGDGTRTRDSLLGRQVLYQTELLPHAPNITQHPKPIRGAFIQKGLPATFEKDLPSHENQSLKLRGHRSQVRPSYMPETCLLQHVGPSLET